MISSSSTFWSAVASGAPILVLYSNDANESSFGLCLMPHSSTMLNLPHHHVYVPWVKDVRRTLTMQNNNRTSLVVPFACSAT